jgi:glucose-1-phosphate cytidylyltransferase
LKVIILAGGLGTRISEETADKPKPMVSIDGKPMLWHIINIYATQGLNDFLVATGYKGEVISDWVRSLDTSLRISAIDTGLLTQTGGRIKKCMELFPRERMLATYGDGVGNVNVKNLLAFHESHGKIATLTAVRPPARFGYLELDAGIVRHFGEKNQSNAGWINGGFFVLEPDVSDFVHSYDEPFETGALPRLASIENLMAFTHEGFWQPMDTLREKEDLSNLAKLTTPPWLAGI